MGRGGRPGSGGGYDRCRRCIRRRVRGGVDGAAAARWGGLLRRGGFASRRDRLRFATGLSDPGSDRGFAARAARQNPAAIGLSMAKHSLDLVFDSYDPADERRREALFALGNGMLLVRACTPEAVADGVHYPGTYRAGCYDRLTSDIEGEKVENEWLVNLPNWLSLAFRVKGEAEWFSLDRVAILSYRHTLDFARGTTCRQVRFE